MRDAAHDIRPASGTPPLCPMRAEGVGLRLGETWALRHIDLALTSSGCTAILGPNGAGKSLLLGLLHGLRVPTEGSVTWNGRPASEATSRQAMVFQKPVLLRRSVAANIDFVLSARRSTVDRDALLDRVGLSHKTRHPARLLSGGEAQRLTLARALATSPEVLFLDEPTASLDPSSAQAIERIVAEEAERGTRVVIVTHDIAQARRLADDVVFMAQGRLIEHAPARPFFDAPQSLPARRFLSGALVL